MESLLLQDFSSNFASGTLWAFVPAILAIALALITKQVYVSLFVGIFTGAMFLACGNPIHATGIVFEAMSAKIDVGILAFLIVLGIIVILLQKSGGSTAYGNWASTKIKSKKGALGATAGLGCMIFVDDYFNCLTVGSVMRPVTDKFNVSRSKLAYIIDATAAPVCIIAPISSWAAAVSGQIEGDGLMTFIKTIPFNLYALLTIAFVFYVAFSGFDFGKMKKNEKKAEKGDLLAGETDLPSEDVEGVIANPKGKVRYLLIPIIILIVCCVAAMSYVGYFYDWGSSLDISAKENEVIVCENLTDGSSVFTIFNTEDNIEILEDAGISTTADSDIFYIQNGDKIIITVASGVVFSFNGADLSIPLTEEGLSTTFQGGTFIDSFANTNSSLALAIGSIIALAIIIAYFSITKVVTFKDCTESFTQGFKSMVPAILILVFAWTIGGIMGAKGGYLDAQGFVNTTLASTGFPTWLFPAIFFILACVISFSTGTSWGTFGVLIPLAVSIVGTTANVQVFLTISAILSGAVFGDHVSPISDTTIMASSGAQCNHVDHVKTQLPYAGLVACVCAVSYFILGLILQNVTKYWVGMLVTLGIGFGLLVCAIVVIKLIQLRKKDNDEEIATDETVSVVE